MTQRNNSGPHLYDQLDGKFSRRQFLAYGASSMALFAPKVSEPEFSRTRASATSLLLIHLSGGNDGYNTLVPFSEKDYYRQRPNLALRKGDLIKIDERYAFNSNLSELAQLYREGVVALFPSVGCDEKLTKSHLRAARIWETASPDEKWNSSWYERLHPAIPEVSKIEMEGFDTHMNQLEQHACALRKLSLLLEKLRPQLNNTVVLVYSEFGRSLAENSTLGTDHGSTGLCLVLGASVKGGIYQDAGTQPGSLNTLPGAKSLNTGAKSLNTGAKSLNTFALDFRSLYGAIASNGFKTRFDEGLHSSRPQPNFFWA